MIALPWSARVGGPRASLGCGMQHSASWPRLMINLANVWDQFSFENSNFW